MLVMILSLSLVGMAEADTIKLQWDRHLDDSVTHFKIYSTATCGSNYAILATIEGREAITATVQSPNKTCFVATALDGNGNESAYSNEVYYDDKIPPSVPLNLKIKFDGILTIE